MRFILNETGEEKQIEISWEAHRPNEWRASFEIFDLVVVFSAIDNGTVLKLSRKVYAHYINTEREWACIGEAGNLREARKIIKKYLFDSIEMKNNITYQKI